MKSLLTSVALLLATGLHAFAGGPAKITNLDAALAKAKAENKLLFLEMGREDCENCQALREMVAKQKVKLPESAFVYADVNIDDPAMRKAFVRKFKVIGNILPFVVVAGPDGRQLGARAGSGTAEEYGALIEKARQKAAPKS